MTTDTDGDGTGDIVNKDDSLLRCLCGYETSEGSPTAVEMDGSCPECGRFLDTDSEQAENHG